MASLIGNLHRICEILVTFVGPTAARALRLAADEGGINLRNYDDFSKNGLAVPPAARERRGRADRAT